MPPAGDPGSTLLLDEFFASGDPRFLPELFAASASRSLKALGPRWYADKREFARDALIRYIDDGCLRPGHRALVKSLFKSAEAAGDDEAMAHFMVAIDGMPRRKLVAVPSYDYASNTTVERMALVSDGTAPTRRRMKKGDPNKLTFTRLTRQYLARRAWRYFRTIGRKDPARYLRAMQLALPLYRDEALAKPEQFLDSWGLVNALYWGAPSLHRRPDGVRLRRNTTLADLLPAPIYPKVWASAFESLFEFVLRARSRTVRTWALTTLRDQHSTELRALPIDRVRELLRSPHDEVLVLGAELLKSVRGLERLPVDAWLELLAIDNADVVALVSELVAKYVTPDRLLLEQCVALACARVAPVAQLGLAWAKTKPLRSAADLDVCARIGNAAAPLVRREAVAWFLEALARESFATPEHVRELLDARFQDTRAATIAFVRGSERFRDVLTVWSSLAESPYEDARGALIERMTAWDAQMTPASLRHLWATAILAVHRGSRTKPRVLTQIAQRIVQHPDEASALMPLFRYTLRSVRATERRAAIAAVARAAFGDPAFRSRLAAELPELVLWSPDAP